MESSDPPTALSISPSTPTTAGVVNARGEGLLTSTGAGLATPAGSPPATTAGLGPSGTAPLPSTAYREARRCFLEKRRAAEAAFQEEAANEIPTTVSEPSRQVPRTALAWLIEYGLLSAGAADFDRDALCAEISTSIARPDRSVLVIAAFGRFMLQYHTVQVRTRYLSILHPSHHYHPPTHLFGGFGRFCSNPRSPLSCRLVSLQNTRMECPDEVLQEVLDLTVELRNESVDRGVLGSRYVEPAAEYYANTRAWRAFEIHTREVNARRERRVQDLLARWDRERGPEIESASWGWHPLYALCVGNPYLQQKLPPMPWDHTEEEARRVWTFIRATRTAAVASPVEAKLLRVHMVSIGLNDVR